MHLLLITKLIVKEDLMLPTLMSNLYSASTYIQSNAMLNRAVMEVGGVEVPAVLTANNKDERIERLMRAALFVTTSFFAPALFMPVLNKFFLKQAKIITNPAEKAILNVSKQYLTNDADFMIQGFNKTATELEKKNEFKEISKHFNNVLNRFPDKEILRQKLINVHKNVFATDFILASMCSISVPWLANFTTEKRTKRAGYVGEFEIAPKEYTDKKTEHHKKSQKIKLGISIAIPLAVAASISKTLKNVMVKPEEQLSKMGKLFKKNVHLLDYKNAIFMNKMGYLAVMFAGDMPSYLLACRDKHELKMRATLWSVIFAAMFGVETILNNIVGRTLDTKLGTTLMNKKGFEKAGFFKKLLMKTHDFGELNKMSQVSNLTKKVALGMYWGNFAFTTALLGFGMSILMNRTMKKDVKTALEKDKTK